MKLNRLFIIFMVLSMLVVIPYVSANDNVDVINNDTENVVVENDIENVNIVDDCEDNNNQINYEDNEIFNDYIEYSTSPNSIFVINNYKIFIKNLTKYYGNSERFFVAIWDLNNVCISGMTVTFTVNGASYVRTTNIFGQASIPVNLNSGTYHINTYIANLGNFGSSIYVLPTISGNDIVMYYKNGTQYKATFYDTSGNLLTNTAVTFNINGVIYTRNTNANGIARLNIKLNPGTYIITATNPNTTEQHSNTIKVLSTLSASDLTMNYGDGSQFKVYLVDGQGNPYSGQTVTFNINGVTYSSVTNSNGIASLNVNLGCGSYIVTSSHNGLNISNNIIVK